MNFNIAIADKDLISANTMKKMINWKCKDCNVVAVVEHESEVLKVLKGKNVDIFIIDVKIFRAKGIEISNYIRKKKLPIKTILLTTSYSNYYYIRPEVRPNIDEYVIKTAAFDEMHRAIEHCKLLLFEKKMFVSENDNDSFLENEKLKMVNKSLEYINLHYREKITIDKVSKEHRISSDYLNKIFKEITGETFLYSVRKKRVEKAKDYLKTTDLKVCEIAVTLGFESVSKFSNTFKSFTGMSPSEYRNYV